MALVISNLLLIVKCLIMQNELYNEYIQACLQCMQACNVCTVASLQNAEVNSFARCIQLNMECAAICRSAAELMSLNSTFSGRLIELCMDICNDCAAENGLHASLGVGACRICAEACLHCATVCSTLPGIGAGVE